MEEQVGWFDITVNNRVTPPHALWTIIWFVQVRQRHGQILR